MEKNCNLNFSKTPKDLCDQAHSKSSLLTPIVPLRVSDFVATWISLQCLRDIVFHFEIIFSFLAFHFLSIWQPLLILQGLT